jgi:O-antigen/teichoic acid export membrane protein
MRTTDKYKRLLKDTFVFALGNLGSKLILFFLVPLYTNFLTTEEYGTADLVFTISQFLIPIFSVVIFDAVIRFGLSKDESAEEVLLNGLIVWALGTVGIIIVTPLFGFYKAVADWKWYLCLYSSVSILFPVLMNYLKAIDRNKTYAMVSILQTALLAILNIILLIAIKMGVKGYLLSNILALFMSSIVVVIIARIPSKLRKVNVNKPLLNKMVIYSTPLILNNISWWVIHSSDKIMIEWMIGLSALGIYTVASKIPSLINVIIRIFSQAWGLSAVREYESTNDEKYYSRILSLYSFFIFFACIVIVAIIKPFMSIYVGDSFSDAWHYVPVLLVSAVYSAIASYYGSFYSALKKSMNNMMTTLIGSIINILVNYIFIRIIGIWGAAIGTAVSYIVIALLRMIDIGKYISIRVNWKLFALNSFIIITHSILVSLDLCILPSSIAAITFFVVLNHNEINYAISEAKGLLKRGKR